MTAQLFEGVTTLLCDADGNLFPSEEPAFVASADVTNEFLASLGVPTRFTAEQLRVATTGKNFRTTAGDLALVHGLSVDLEPWVEEERRRVTAHLAQVLRPDRTVLDPLSRLSSRFSLAAVSSSATSRLQACFDATGLTQLFPADRLFSAEDSLTVPTSKPDPAVYLHACACLGVAAGAALAVEDSVPGARSAIAAGIRTVGNVQFVPAPEREQRTRLLLEAGAEAVVGSWLELEEALSAAA